MSTCAYSTTLTKTAVGTLPVPAELDQKTHHVIKNGTRIKFRNPHPSYHELKPLTALSKLFIPLLTGKLKYPDVTPPTVTVQPPDFLPTRFASPKLRATWLGHACYYVEFPSGLRVLFDPVFEPRCSPFSFAGPKRYTDPPCKLSDIPFIDAILISHSHYDHLSHPSILSLAKSHPKAHFFVGLGLAKWFHATGISEGRVTELDWWSDVDVTLTPENDSKTNGNAVEAEIKATVSCLPCQHTSARTPFDRDTTLWCSWAVSSGGKKIWFGGDTGYRAVPEVAEGIDDYGEDYLSLPKTPQFAEIGQLRGPFDLGLIPIGAYEPRFLMSSMHANPFDAVEIFTDTKCRRALGIHWGTWALTIEEVLEPPKLLKAALKRKDIKEEGVFDVCDIGESREFD